MTYTGYSGIVACEADQKALEIEGGFMCMFDMVDYTAMGIRLKRRREEMNLTQKQLAERVGVSTSFIGHIERAEKIASLETMARLAYALDMAMDYLVLGIHPECLRDACPLYASIHELLKNYGFPQDQH